MPETKGPTQYVGLRLKTGGVRAAQSQADKHHAGNLSDQLRRMLRYAAQNMPERWDLVGPAKPPPAEPKRRGGRLPDPGEAAICGRCLRPRAEHGGEMHLGACPGEQGLYAKRFQIVRQLAD